MRYNNYFNLDIEATGEKISQLIVHSGLSDKEIGGLMNLSVQCINKWRHGKGIPDIENLYILKQILGIKIDDFFVPKNHKELEYQIDVESISNVEFLQGRFLEYFIRIQKLKIRKEIDAKSACYN